MVPSGVGPWGQTHGGRDMGSCCSILHFLLLVNPRGVDGGWGRVVATDYAAPENIFAHFWRGGAQKNFFVGFPNISWPGQLSTG